MLSFGTIVAIQLIAVLNKHRDRGLKLTDLKDQTKFNNFSVNQVVRKLKQRKWIMPKGLSSNVLVIDPEEKTLYDLVVAVDGGVRLGSQIAAENWGSGAREKLLGSVRINERLAEDFSATLKNISLLDMIVEEEVNMN